MSISFEKKDGELLLCYSPYQGIDALYEKLSTEGELVIKRTFIITRDAIRLNNEDADEDTMVFCVGIVGKDYTEIRRDTLGTQNSVFFANDIVLKQNMFIADRKVSILRKMVEIAGRDIYIGGNWEEFEGGMPFEAFQEMVYSFPNATEIYKYVYYRIADRIKEYIPESDKYKELYRKYMKKKERTPSVFLSNQRIEYEQFSIALDELKEMLIQSEMICESEWQKRIYSILQLLYPKYILCTREVCFDGIDGYNKRPDFLLVDTNGYIDILEIKKPSVQLLGKQASYRNNYVPTREFSGTIQQIEKYIFTLSSKEKSGKQVIDKLSKMLPEGIVPDIVNPQGIIIAGCNSHFNAQQRKDFELIKRQYKHVADIMTYDDLVKRLDNVVWSLKRQIDTGL